MSPDDEPHRSPCVDQEGVGQGVPLKHHKAVCFFKNAGMEMHKATHPAVSVGHLKDFLLMGQRWSVCLLGIGKII